MIRLLMKELDPTSGTITVMDENLGKMKHKHIPKYRRRIGVVFQDFRLLKDRNVYENIAFALRVTRDADSYYQTESSGSIIAGRIGTKV